MTTRRSAALALTATIGVVLYPIDARGQDRPGWVTQWTDHFGDAAVDTSRWEVLTRRDSFNNELQYYHPDQVTVTGGNLRLTATNQPLDGKNYRSGLVRTWGEQTYGRWEVRASLPATQGMWPAIWLLPRFANWPAGGEIDIMENRGSQPFTIGSAYHYGSSVANHQFVADDFGYSVNGQPVSFHGQMHNYAVEWDPNRVRYFVDGVPHFTFYSNTAPVSSTPMSLILNLAVGGDYGGNPNAGTVFPQRFDIDSVRVYQRSVSAPQLGNTSFEQTAGGLLADWDEYSGSGGGNVRTDGVTANARSGSGAAQMWGRFDGSTWNNSGLFQELPAAPGQTWQVGSWGRNRPGDELAGENTAGIKLEFLNAGGQVIDVAALRAADASTPTAYREFVLRRTAPPGTAFARTVLEVIQINSAGGAVNFDDTTALRVGGSVVPGDVNLDGLADAKDLDALLHSLTNANAAFDFNGDASVNDADVDQMLADAFGTARGDLDLDGAIDFDDVRAAGLHYGTLGSGTWAIGDLTGEGNVAADDVLLLARGYGPGPTMEFALRAAGVGEPFITEWTSALGTVPEPSAAAPLLAAGAIALARRRRR